METLVILFILYSLFQWFFGDNKKKQQEKQRRRQQQQDQMRQSEPAAEKEGPQSWEEAMHELESIFTGEQPKRQQPAPQPQPSPRTEPAYSSSSRTDNNQSSSSKSRDNDFKLSEDPFSDDMTTRRRSTIKGMGADLADLDELENSDNPIFNRSKGLDEIEGLDDMSISTDQARDILDNITNPEAARQAIIMKEILDRPKAMRRNARNF